MSAAFLVGRERVFGLDIGYETLSLCQIRYNGNHANVVGIVKYPITERILDKDRIKNKAQVANMIKEARRKAKPHPIQASGIISALPESFVFSKTIQIPKMKTEELKTAIPNEAARYLPIPLEQVYVDYQILITHPNESQMDVLIAASPKKLVDDYVELAKMANLKLTALETKPLAVGRAIIPNNSKEGVLILHIGTELARISIWDKGNIRLVTTASVGKNQLLENIQSVNPAVNDINKAKINNDNKEIILTTLSDIISEVLESIRYHQNRSYKPTKITRIELCGSGAQISNLDDLIEEQTKIKCHLSKPKISTNIEIKPDFITAFGLALRESC